MLLLVEGLYWLFYFFVLVWLERQYIVCFVLLVFWLWYAFLCSILTRELVVCPDICRVHFGVVPGLVGCYMIFFYCSMALNVSSFRCGLLGHLMIVHLRMLRSIPAQWLNHCSLFNWVCNYSNLFVINNKVKSDVSKQGLLLNINLGTHL